MREGALLQNVGQRTQRLFLRRAGPFARLTLALLKPLLPGLGAKGL